MIGCDLDKNSTDVDLVLHTYQVWGEICLDKPSGDFAFAIWDSIKQRFYVIASEAQSNLKPLLLRHSA